MEGTGIMQHSENWLRRAGIGTGIVLALSWASPAWAPPCAYCKTTSVMLQLTGTSFVPPNPCVGAGGEGVSLAGEVHVVTKVGLNFVTDVHLNMAGVSGAGQTTGNMYIGTGSNKLLSVQLTPNQF